MGLAIFCCNHFSITGTFARHDIHVLSCNLNDGATYLDCGSAPGYVGVS